MAKYLCVNTCYVFDEIHYVGKVYEFEEGTELPRHFEPYSEDASLFQLRKEAAKAGLYFEPAWGIDRLEELVGKRPPPHKAAKMAAIANKKRK